MKRALLPIGLGLLLALSAKAVPADTWVNWNVINAPPDVPPMVDALNFVNSNSITIAFTNFTLNPELFETSETLNFTNVGFMSCSAGWQFDTEPVSTGLARPARSIYNSGSIFAGTAPLFIFGTQVGGQNGIFGFNLGFGGAKVIGSADYIFNSGTIEAAQGGIVKLTGGDLSLSRSALNVEGSGSGVFDNYWGAGTNVMNPQQQFDPDPIIPFPFNLPRTPFHTVTQVVAGIYLPTGTQLVLTNAKTWVNDTTIGTNRTVQIVLLSEPNTAISNNVYFNFFADIAVEWISFATNPVTGDVVTNYLNLLDDYSNPPTTNNFVQTNNIFPSGLVTFIPTNFFLFSGGPFFETFGGLTNIGFTNIIQPAPQSSIHNVFAFDQDQTVTNQYAGYSANVFPFSSLTNDVAHRSVSNLDSRVELSASRVLDLNRTRIANPNYVSLKSTNHFAGNVNAQIDSAFWDLDLGTTNSSITISNLLKPLSRLNGVVNFYRARWTNHTATPFATNQAVYHVLVVDSHLETLGTPQVNDFYLRKPNNTDVIISDEVDVMRNFQINAKNLTITSNNITDPVTFPTPFYPFGSINFLNNNILWSTALPNLRNLTNYGGIFIQNGAFFGGQRVSPFISTGPGDWYDSLINYGYVSVQGLTVYAKYFIDSGTNLIDSGILSTNNGTPVLTGVLDAGQGPMSIYSLVGEITNGILGAVNSSISLNSGTLGVSNSLIFAGGPLTLSISNQLDDGSLTNCVSAVSNKPVWICQGFNLTYLPPFASLFATTVSNSTLAYHQVVNVWAGRDVGGANNNGFFNNAAVGRLVLDGGHPDSLFTFAPATGNNALYVDDIEFLNYATNVDGLGNYYGINIQPGMKIYYAEAKSYSGSNVTSIAEKLNGANNGRFVWMSNYNCGFFSSTPTNTPTGLPYVDPNTGIPYTVNNGLSLSTHIDSDNDNIVNYFDTTPFGTNIPPCDACPPFALPAFLAGDNSSFGPGNGSTNSGSDGAPVVQYPGSTGSGDVAPYQSLAQVTGSYSGLFADTNTLSTASSGYFTATTTAKGKVTGKFLIGNRSYSFSKQLDADGEATATISRVPLHALEVHLKVNLAGANEITGTVSDSRWVAQLVAHRQIFDKKFNPATQYAGAYTLRIPGNDVSGHPAGDGFATVKIDQSGAVQMSGALADGTKITQKSTISAAGYWPMYVSAYQGAGCAEGWLQLINQRIAGDVFWLKPSGLTGASAKSYIGGFTNHAAAAGLSYVAPKSNQQPVSWNWGQIVLSGGGVSGLWTNTFYLDLPGHNFVPGNSTLKLGFTASSGLFQGSIVNPNDNQQIKFQGVLFQNVNVGLGYFLNSGLSGQLYLGAAP